MENIKDSPEVQVLPSLIRSADSNQILGYDDDGVIKQDSSKFEFMVSFDVAKN